MSVQSIGQSSGDNWLQQLLASYGQTRSSQSSILSLLSQGSDATDGTSATSSDASASTTSSVGSFNDILTALLNGTGLSYDMETGSLTASGQAEASGEAGMPPPPFMQGTGRPELTRSATETKNDDGSTTRNVTMTNAEGKVVGTEKTTENADGSFTTVMTMTDPGGNTSTRTINGENTDDGFKVTDTLTNADGNVLERRTHLTAADGSVTSSVTRNGPDGGSVAESESYDADGNLLSTTSSTTSPATSVASADSTSGGAGASGGSSASGASSSGGSESSDNDSTTTTVTTTFTSESMQETITVTDVNGKIVSQKTKDIPFSRSAKGSSFGSNVPDADSLADITGQYLHRYGANRYGSAQSQTKSDSGSGGLSVEA
ncbi:conserved hypothetical protein [Solidesulfovibrio fructosivorans JJ]]|uniref:Uncharacterized protein n=1 Tax=Solidesulfovibrio fructosivorans JJ] TaxID=596151 RepID=E1JVT7_SOLFR|nr:hypothetical protein [Solidesulfovibrio fructosivorans]EFL51575.1 conserved hypothetical protein [Solidesulfovibrio fructosivorans JJ]]